MPVSPIADNINIFQPQMSQMAPMSMMPPAQPVQAMQQGGAAAPRQTEIMGQPHMLAYITPQEGGILEGIRWICKQARTYGHTTIWIQEMAILVQELMDLVERQMDGA
jgi:hypothetical protein